MNTLTENQAKYIAGILDGDGSLTIYRWKRKGTHGTSYLIHLSCSNTSRTLVDWLKKTVGEGSICAPRVRNINSKQLYRWSLSHAQVGLLLTQVYHYLVIMRQKAELVLLFCRNPDHEAAWNQFHAMKHSVACPDLIEMSPAYAAGFIDAEGSIETHRAVGNHGRQRQEYSVGLRVVNTQNHPLVDLQQYFRVGNLIVRNNGVNRKPIWRWQLKAKKAELVLSQVQPFLVAKASQCAYCLEVRRTIREGEARRYIKGHVGKINTPFDILERLYHLWDRIRVLNHRGIECPA